MTKAPLKKKTKHRVDIFLEKTNVTSDHCAEMMLNRS